MFAVTSDAYSIRLAEYLPMERNHLEKSIPDSGYVAALLTGFRLICEIFSNNLYVAH
jgi:hypothetical protein